MVLRLCWIFQLTWELGKNIQISSLYLISISLPLYLLNGALKSENLWPRAYMACSLSTPIFASIVDASSSTKKTQLTPDLPILTPSPSVTFYSRPFKPAPPTAILWTQQHHTKVWKQCLLPPTGFLQSLPQPQAIWWPRPLAHLEIWDGSRRPLPTGPPLAQSNTSPPWPDAGRWAPTTSHLARAALLLPVLTLFKLREACWELFRCFLKLSFSLGLRREENHSLYLGEGRRKSQGIPILKRKCLPIFQPLCLYILQLSGFKVTKPVWPLFTSPALVI